MSIKTLLVNTYDFGGAANACIRLHNGLLAMGADSKLLVKHKTNAELFHTYQHFNPAKQPSAVEKVKGKAIRILKELKLAPPYTVHEREELRKREFIKQRPAGLDLFTYPETDIDITTSEVYKQADVVNLHWVADFVDFESFFEKNKKPVVWTLHDESPFLDGEHYAERFLGMDSQGTPILRKYTASELAEAEKIMVLKYRALKNVQHLHIVSPSKWLLNRSASSKLFGRFAHHHIPNGFPTHIFKPHNQTFARQVLGIPTGKTVILFVAETITNQRKGYAYLQQAFDGLSSEAKDNTVLCAVGKKKHATETAGIMEFGKVVDERLMALLYSAADAFVIPSLEDNLPNTMIESMLCGTPVIGFAAGGIPEAVNDGITGYLSTEISVQGLRKSIEKFLAQPAFFNRSAIASSTAALYSLSSQANSYIQLYSQISKKA